MDKLSKAIERVGDILNFLPEVESKHSRDDNLYKFLDKVLIESIEDIYKEDEHFKFGMFGDIYIPFVSFGTINTKDLFGLDELIIFSYYNKMKDEYKVSLDLGANIGLHSVLMGKSFKNVISFEPDEFHSSIFTDVMHKNGINNVELKKMAISRIEGDLEFTRLKGNTTGSHISGSKDLVYGEIEKFNVACTTLAKIIEEYNPDFIKMDIEGQERDVLLSTEISSLKDIDMMIEISNEKSAEDVFNYFKDSEVNLFSQKTNWKRVFSKVDMPFSYKEGSLFLSSKDVMKWND